MPLQISIKIRYLKLDYFQRYLRLIIFLILHLIKYIYLLRLLKINYANAELV